MAADPYRQNSAAPILVAGGGCAALSAAITLARIGCDAVVVAPPVAHSEAGLPETLNQGGIQLLCELGLSPRDLSDVALRVPSQVSRWGTGPAEVRSAGNLSGHTSYVIDKQALVIKLSDVVARHGVKILRADVRDARSLVQGLAVEVRDCLGNSTNLPARFLVDATGRRRAIARCFGARQVTIDRLVSFWLTLDRPPIESAIAVSTIPDGWLFFAPRKSGGVALGFFTSGKVIQGRPSAKSIADRMVSAPDLAHIAGNPRDWESTGPVITRNATTSILRNACGQYWVACGDALQTIDPLASSGVFNALTQGIAAGKTAKKAGEGDSTAGAHYERQALASFSRYLVVRKSYYSGGTSDSVQSTPQKGNVTCELAT